MKMPEAAQLPGPRSAKLGAKDCTPEIDTSEIIVDFQWHFPMDCQWHFPPEFHLSVVLSNGLSLVHWICSAIVQWIVSGVFQCVFVIFLVRNILTWKTPEGGHQTRPRWLAAGVRSVPATWIGHLLFRRPPKGGSEKGDPTPKSLLSHVEVTSKSLESDPFSGFSDPPLRDGDCCADKMKNLSKKSKRKWELINWRTRNNKKKELGTLCAQGSRRLVPEGLQEGRLPAEAGDQQPEPSTENVIILIMQFQKMFSYQLCSSERYGHFHTKNCQTKNLWVKISRSLC